MSAAASQSSTQQTSQQFTTQGGAGTTITGGGTSATGGGIIASNSGQGSIIYNDPSTALAALQGAGEAIKEALQGSNNLQAQVAQIGAAQQGSNADLIQQVLSQEQALASQATVGKVVSPGLFSSFTPMQMIIGAGVVLLGVFLIFKKS